MSKSKLGRTDATSVDDEIARLRDLDLKGLRARWRGLFRSEAPSPLPGHLLFGMIAYQLQADLFGDLDAVTRKAVDGNLRKGPQAPLSNRLAAADRQRQLPETGAMLMREWNGRQHRVMAMADGYAWNGKTYKSLSQIAFAITGTKWNGPRFFGMRDTKPPIQNTEAS
jgi:hypothetical protein